MSQFHHVFSHVDRIDRINRISNFNKEGSGLKQIFKRRDRRGRREKSSSVKIAFYERPPLADMIPGAHADGK